MRQGAKIVVAGLVLFPSSLTALESHSRSQLPDRLPRIESANFAFAAMRAELEPAYRKRGLGLDFEGAIWNRHFYSWMVVPTWGQGLDYFEVDRRTGDVWADSGCERVR